MAQQAHPSGRVTRSDRIGVEAAWWAALLVVPLVLGLVGRGEPGGFWSVFFWGVVAFVLGSVVAHVAVAATVRAQAGDSRLTGAAPRTGGGLA